MKGKGYRSNVAKAVWIVIVHLAAVAAVICAAFFVMIYQTGIRLDDRGKSYIQSEGFRERLNSRGTDILESLSAKEDINYLTNAGSSAVIDLAEFKEKEINRDSLSELSFKNTSGVAYSVKDLLEWAQDWTGVGEGYDDVSLDDAGQFIQCKASDGSSYYFSLSDFKKLVTDGTLKVDYDQDIMEEYDDSYETKFAEKTENQKIDAAIELGYWSDSDSRSLGSITDKEHNTEYPEFYFCEIEEFTEKFKPQGAESLPDAVNSSTEWNGKLEDAYNELAKVLDCIRAVQDDINVSDCAISLTSVYHTSGDYEEGSTNLTYLFADKEKKTIYTNRKAYSSYSQLEQNLETIFKEKAYAVVYPELSKCVTNIPDADLQVWNHTIDQSFDTKDFVFAVSVDTKFSVADSMADEAENYETYSKLMFPMLAVESLSFPLCSFFEEVSTSSKSSSSSVALMISLILSKKLIVHSPYAFILHVISFSEKCGTYPHDICAAFYRQLKIIGHAHGKIQYIYIIHVFVPNVNKQFMHFRKIFNLFFGTFTYGRYGHESLDP